MNFLKELFAAAVLYLPAVGTLAFTAIGLVVINWLLKKRWQNNPDAQFKFQLIMLALTFAGGLTVIVALPVSDTLRGQLLSLIGILLSAAIALSSTTFIGNIMAGIMLKAIKSVRPGDFVTVADVTGRVTEMDLLHSEIQTEDRDLITVPNLYLVTQPLRVVRSSGTIVSAEVSLGYDVEHHRVSELLRTAVAKADLKDGFVHVRALGDFSVLYRAAGLLEEVTSLISARSKLREAMLDALHAAGIEIVSPNFMNTRALSESNVFVPKVPQVVSTEVGVAAEDLAFDKADEAASVEGIRKSIEQLEMQMEEMEKTGDEASKEAISVLEAKKAGLLEELKASEERRKIADKVEESGAKTQGA